MGEEDKPKSKANGVGKTPLEDAPESARSSKDEDVEAKPKADPKISAAKRRAAKAAEDDDAEVAPPAAATAAASAAPPPPGDPETTEKPEQPEKKAWGAPFAKLDRAWTTLESRLCTAVLVAEILTLVFWIAIRALSATGKAGPGMIFRSLLTALVLGAGVHLATKKHPRREILTSVAFFVGLFAGTRWGDAGTTYFSNLFAWLQNASILVFFGGASELAKRLTLWLALLGASLATAQGKHINVDVVMRFLSPRARVPVAVLGWVAAAVVSITASWGFFDYVVVEELRAPPTNACADDATKRCPVPPGQKVSRVMDTIGRNAFLAGRQLSLDLRSFPKVITGTPYNQWLKPPEWNEWLRGGGWEPRFKAEDVKAFELPEDGTVEYRNPSVTAIPGGNEAIPKILVPLLNLVFAFGLLVIGLRFILRSLLALSGWVKVDPAAAHGDDELAHAHDHSAGADVVEAAIKGTHS